MADEPHLWCTGLIDEVERCTQNHNIDLWLLQSQSLPPFLQARGRAEPSSTAPHFELQIKGPLCSH